MHQVPSIDPSEVGDQVMVDVREADEWSAGRAANAVHIPLYDLPDRVSDLPGARPLLVVCRVGSRSAQATAWLWQQGIEAYNVDGGMLRWAALGLPIEGDGERPWIV